MMHSATQGTTTSRARWGWTVLGIVVIAGVGWVMTTQRAHKDGRHVAVTVPKTGRDELSHMAGMNTATNGSIMLTAAQLRQFGVTFGTVDMRPLITDLRVPGIVAIDERATSQVALKFGGYVERLYVNATGQSVRRGQPLLEIYSPDLVAVQEELLLSRQLQHDIGTSAIPGVPVGSTNFVDAAKERLRLWDISETQIAEILHSGRARRTLTLYAPATGIVTEKSIVQGQAIMPGASLFTIANLSTVWIIMDVRETDASHVRVGSPTTIELASFPGRSLTGRVEYIYPTMQHEARTLKARVAVANPDGRLRPGMYAVVHITTAQTPAVTVLTSAVLRTGERNLVFVDMGHGTLIPREVELGRTAGQYTEILAGLEPGQRIVTSAQFLLDSESNLGDVMKAMIGQMGTGDKSMGGMQDMPGMDMPGMTTPPRR